MAEGRTTIGGLKDDTKKTPTDLLPPLFMLGIARVLGFGAGKYGRFNYRDGIEYLRLYGAALRHLFSWYQREECDPESGESHLLHAATNLLMLYEMTQIRPDLDDRPKF